MDQASYINMDQVSYSNMDQVSYSNMDQVSYNNIMDQVSYSNSVYLVIYDIIQITHSYSTLSTVYTNDGQDIYCTLYSTVQIAFFLCFLG